ncbi:Uu.00g117840.m01.CDS01 [Anthostomella pinea]|uniref:Uu.00g117840.m01.CDS01 n=1 Tax=Anthostomella pinea TaxID=933095 RepID=A0AAI8VH92_9PEZI|nr:Uu.00g117840.m01.CDS01 [Anthostomella pinea]
MFSSLTTKLALRKAGLSSDTFDLSSKPSKPAKDGSVPGLDDADESNNGSAWPAWMNKKKLPLTAQAWLSPVPPPVPIAECPKAGDLAPLDRDRQLEFGGGRPVVVLFLRCVGCAFAQKSFLALRALANKNQGSLRCLAVSHSSAAATRKWMDLLGGAWNIEVIIDEDRAIYAAWGLGLGTVWSMFNPTTQVQGWKEKGWLGIKVADSIQRTGADRASPAPRPGPRRTGTGMSAASARGAEADSDEAVGPSTVMGNKWQQAGLFAVDGRGTVVWAAKALRADDVMDMGAAAAVVGF